jgi:hypothetical protein
MQYTICNMQYAISKMQYTICTIKYCHNVICNKLYAMANGNMLYSIDNTQYGIWNIQSFNFNFRISKPNCLSLLIFVTLPYTFIWESIKAFWEAWYTFSK